MNSELNQLFINVCMDLWAGDCGITYELFIETLNERIDNLYSHIGKEAHERYRVMGVEDNTGLSWIEQDKQILKEIERYQKLIDYLKDDSNWTP